MGYILSMSNSDQTELATASLSPSKVSIMKFLNPRMPLNSYGCVPILTASPIRGLRRNWICQ